MNERREIKVNPSYLNYKKQKPKKDKTSSSTKKNQIVNINNKNVKELLLKKLKEYKKNKTRKNEMIPSNSQINPSFMEKIRKNKNKVEKNIIVNNSNNEIIPLNSNINTNFSNSNLNSNLSNPNFSNSNLNTNLSNSNLSNTNFSNSNLNSNFSNSNIKQQPRYSNLKNSLLPTYRQLKSQNNKETVDIEIKKHYSLGKSKTQKKISVLLKGNVYKDKNKNNKCELKKTNLKTVKNYLKKNNLIKYGSNAPNELLREIFETVKVCGNVKNNNGTQLLHNYMNDNTNDN